jgi:hypothetical protein
MDVYSNRALSQYKNTGDEPLWLIWMYTLQANCRKPNRQNPSSGC